MNWLWWVLIFFGVGGFTKIADMGRTALRTRHERKLELLESQQAREREQREALESASRPPQPICGCTHHLAKHDKQGRCHETVEVPVAWDGEKKPTGYGPGPCNCQQYIGPQPLSTYYAEDLTDLA
ncbi:hypothetical protein [Streptomyces sp. UNOC14_S4]|uniref:hypothetical protein n=1 Tax=Streptomyces sp. UNOC14_S4 TaxID=2872340 RepID=UPI001E625C99|nr:hypothetical protein [Streptomyces sp. UNOC14_S4]MCC3769430.1 hypothetical protein [Streptomyces sp. UNOC14_S4]